MRVLNIRCQRQKEKRILPVVEAMCCRENADPPIVKCSEKSVRRSIRWGLVWYPVREHVLRTISIRKKEGKCDGK